MFRFAAFTQRVERLLVQDCPLLLDKDRHLLAALVGNFWTIHSYAEADVVGASVRWEAKGPVP